jgi:hypothetical protein
VPSPSAESKQYLRVLHKSAVCQQLPVMSHQDHVVAAKGAVAGGSVAHRRLVEEHTGATYGAGIATFFSGFTVNLFDR